MLNRIKIRTFKQKDGNNMIDMRALTNQGELSKNGIFIRENEIPEFIDQLHQTIDKRDTEEKRIATMLKQMEDNLSLGY